MRVVSEVKEIQEQTIGIIAVLQIERHIQFLFCLYNADLDHDEVNLYMVDFAQLEHTIIVHCTCNSTLNLDTLFV